MVRLELKIPSRRKVSLHKRDLWCLSSLDRLNIKFSTSIMNTLSPLVHLARKGPARRAIMSAIIYEILKILELSLTEIPERPLVDRTNPEPMTLNRIQTVLVGLDIECSKMFRFRNYDQLRQSLLRFSILLTIVTKKEHPLEYWLPYLSASSEAILLEEV